MTSAKEQIIAKLLKEGFKEQSMKPGLFMHDLLHAGCDLSGLSEGKPPVTGIFINHILEDEGHGNVQIYDLRREILHIWDAERKQSNHVNPNGSNVQPPPESNASKETYICSECKRQTNKTQAKKSFETYLMPLCSDCHTKRDNELAMKKKTEPTVEQVKSKPPENKIMPEVIVPDGIMHKPDSWVPIKIIAPQGSYIKGFMPAMKEIGKIKIGTKGEMTTSAKGTQYRPPIKFDHFEIVGLLRDQNGNLIPDPVMKELGENLKELDIFLLYNDETLNFTTRYNEYRGGKCQCSGDGVKAHPLDSDEKECNPDTCQKFKDKKCKPNGILSVILAKSPRLGGVYKFRTTSYNSIRSILSSLFFIKNLTGGILAMIPLKLTISPMTVQPKDSATPQTIYVVNVEFVGTLQQLLEKTVEVSKYQSMMRMNIKILETKARAALTLPESEEDINEIEAEFYPAKEEVK